MALLPVSALAGPLIPGLDWRASLLQASFRGVPFEVSGHEMAGGRRAAVHEFALRDAPVTEDLGAVARRHSIEGYVVGEDYALRRDALIDAVFAQSGPGTLVHPYLGELQVQPLEGCAVREQLSPGRIATFRLIFVDAGTESLVGATADTAATVLAAASLALSAVKLGYAVAAVAEGRPGFLSGLIGAALTDLGESFLGLPVGTAAAVIQAVSGVAGVAPADTTATADAVAATFAAARETALDAPIPGDRTAGIATLAEWDGIADPATLATPDRVQQQANATALRDLVRGCAVAEIAAIAAQSAFDSDLDALGERARLAALIDARAEAAADAGDDAAYAAWQQLGAAVAADLGARARQLRRLATYALARSLPVLALAHRLTGDAAQADALAARNAALHPLFMPAAGLYLAPEGGA